MSSFFDKAKAQAQNALNQGKEKLDEVQASREGSDKLRKLGVAYFNSSRGRGNEQALQEALDAVRDHVRMHGEDFLTKAESASGGFPSRGGHKHAA
ncbi:hypothetical protein SRB5_37820 [Streptomyces sp. RB5]|uniref:Antitoxin n=1 Tax=Streptomyces smaragdinus TaxID=2585196 RepID=A0A7K0CKW6_9ACTN|nr:hypothetical protein [Streptomyces smaragdinus]MQY13632.1 hypothetical protein [Streptomyces smaragdinus]